MARHGRERQIHNQWPVDRDADVLWRLVVNHGLPIANDEGDLAIAAFRQGRLPRANPEERQDALYMVHALAIPAWEVARLGGREAFTQVPSPPGIVTPLQRPHQARLNGLLVVHGVRAIINGGDPSPLSGEASYSLFSNGTIRLTDEAKPADMNEADYQQHAANMLAHLAMKDVSLPPWSEATAGLAGEVVGRNPFIPRGIYPFTEGAMRAAVNDALGR